MGLLDGIKTKKTYIKHTVANHCYEVTRDLTQYHLYVDGVEYDFGTGNLSGDTPDGIHVEVKVEWRDVSLFINGVQESHTKK